MALIADDEDAPVRGGRAGTNDIWKGRLLQRGQIITWQRTVKAAKLREWGVTAVVNFWPKTDADLGELELDFYWQLSANDSIMMLRPHMVLAAVTIASYLDDPSKKVLVLCEAGKTRSVFFCILVVRELLDCSYEKAQKAVLERLKSVSLKGFMQEWFKDQDK